MPANYQLPDDKPKPSSTKPKRKGGPWRAKPIPLPPPPNKPRPILGGGFRPPPGRLPTPPNLGGGGGGTREPFGGFDGRGGHGDMGRYIRDHGMPGGGQGGNGGPPLGMLPDGSGQAVPPWMTGAQPMPMPSPGGGVTGGPTPWGGPMPIPSPPMMPGGAAIDESGRPIKQGNDVWGYDPSGGSEPGGFTGMPPDGPSPWVTQPGVLHPGGGPPPDFWKQLMDQWGGGFGGDMGGSPPFGGGGGPQGPPGSWPPPGGPVQGMPSRNFQMTPQDMLPAPHGPVPDPRNAGSAWGIPGGPSWTGPAYSGSGGVTGMPGRGGGQWAQINPDGTLSRGG